MGLFKKKEEKKVYLPSSENKDAEMEAAKLKALEASLEFLNDPKREEKTKKQEEPAPAENEKDTEENAEAAPEEKKEPEAETPKAKTPKETTLTSAVKPNPVAPAVQPPSGKTLDPNAANQNTEEKKSDTAPVPKPQENTEEKPATSMASKQWGRRMDYKTAVVKPQSPTQEVPPPTKPLAPTAVSNVPPAPRMPSNSLHTLNSQNKMMQQQAAQQQAAQQPQPPKMPAKTIVPSVPEVPGKGPKNEKPTVATMNAPIPAQAENAPTIVASNAENNEIPKVQKASQNASQKAETVQGPKPALAEIPVKAQADTKNVAEADGDKPENVDKTAEKTAEKTEAVAAPANTGMQRAIPASPVQIKKETEEKGLKAGNTGMIPNPLPTPKKHIPKEMDFDIQPPASQMHFDIVDMTGMDFFDIN